MRIRKLAQKARQLSPAGKKRPPRQIESPIVGDSICPPETQCARTNEIVHHSIYGNQNQVARGGCSSAERYFREGMLALPYRFHKFNGASGYV